MERAVTRLIVVIIWRGFGNKVLIWYVEVAVLLDTMITTKQGGVERTFRLEYIE